MNEENQQSEIIKPYKYKELRAYSSTEWLAGNRKKYRQVFDRQVTTYVYAELSLYNKLYDQDAWDMEVELRCYSLKGEAKQICNLEFKRKVSKFDQVVYVREGWGNKKKGTFWKRGTYYWEAWLNGEKIGTKFFYIEDSGGDISDVASGYVQMHSVKLYEGEYDDEPPEDRRYMQGFNVDESRYIYTELDLLNKLRGRDWQCEVFIKYFNSARELKGQVTRLVKVKAEEEFIHINAGWGSNSKGSWREGEYEVDIVFMDQWIASVPFVVGHHWIEGIAPARLPGSEQLTVVAPDPEDVQDFDEVMTELDALIGLADVKKEIKDHAEYIRFIHLRKDRGFEERIPLSVHSVFIGNPGTGKTTVAQMMGRLYKQMGLLSKGHVHEVDRVDLVGEYIGQTAPKVKDAFEKARGGVLFIDEAYSLARAQDDSKDFGREVIELLVKEMSNGPGDMVVIAAGYPREMKYFLDSNPGLKSRFKLKYEFDDYLPQELIAISKYAAEQEEVKLSTAAENRVAEIITDAFRNRDRSFGNARFVYNLIEKAKINLGLRVMQKEDPENLPKKTLLTVQKSDIDAIQYKSLSSLPDIPIDQKLLTTALYDLDQLIGLESVKTQIREMVDLVSFFKKTGQDVLGQFSLHTVFIGNPGTGKTTIARILTRIYKALGILERGHIVETDRQGLVAGYVGQTAIKTSEKIDEAEGGVLFIDEAYALTVNRQGGGYGGEAIQTLLKRMEDERGKFFVFVAGYPKQMDQFLKANPGLSSRFDKILKFEDYNAEELFAIAQKMCLQKKVHISKKGSEVLREILVKLSEFRTSYFGNARVVRSIVDDAIKNMHLRIAKEDKTHKSGKVLQRIQVSDLERLSYLDQDKAFEEKGIGF